MLTAKRHPIIFFERSIMSFKKCIACVCCLSFISVKETHAYYFLLFTFLVNLSAAEISLFFVAHKLFTKTITFNKIRCIIKKTKIVKHPLILGNMAQWLAFCIHNPMVMGWSPYQVMLALPWKSSPLSRKWYQAIDSACYEKCKKRAPDSL